MLRRLCLCLVLLLVACRPRLDHLPYEDDFEKPNSGWDVYEADYASASYQEGQYVIQVHQPHTEAWGMAGKRFDDVLVQVDARLVDGVSGDYGVVCRYQNHESFYYLGITSDGVGFILVSQPGQGFQVINRTRSDAIRLGWDANQLRVACVGERLALTVNEKLILEAQDGRLGRGDIGLAAGTFGQTNTRVHFDNLLASAPEQ